MNPNVMGMDNVEPFKSWLKMYFTSGHTSFQSVREVMTMGGLQDVSESSLQDLRSLNFAVFGLPDDFPEDAEISVESTGGNAWPDFDALCEGFVYFFRIAPTTGKPEVKFYLTTRKYGADDLTIARNLMAWLHAHGRGAYADTYLGMLEKLAEHRGLENGKGIMLTSATNVPRRENQTSSCIFLPSYTTERDMLQSEKAMLGNPHDWLTTNPR